jgi:CheY-like chemotaxis protein
MNGILGFSQLLEGERFGPLNAKQKEFVAAVLGSGNHLLKLIDEVLELSKIETGKLTVTLESVDLLPVCKSVFASLTQLAGSYGVYLEFGDSALGFPPVLVDRTRFAQCLLNIGSNAIKYNRPDGKVKFSYQLIGDDLVRISVADTGIGIPKERQNELFQPFNRLGAEQKAIEGTGVGLALTQRLVHLMGGSIGFKSAADEGSTFWIDLPRYRREDNLEVLREVRAMTTNNNIGYKLLYVEDNAMNRALIRNICSALETVTVIESADGNSGLEAARRERPDVILLDINLPDQNGFALLQQLKRDPTFASTPILALSANAMPSDIKRGLAAGFYRYLSKPIVVSALLDAIDQALDASKFPSQPGVTAICA